MAISRGEFGENLAAEFLERHGYSIEGKRLTLGHLEIDLVAKIGGLTVLVEVKTRFNMSLGPAQDHLSHQKITRLKRGLAAFSKQHRIQAIKLRLDFIAIDIDSTTKLANIKHFTDILG